MREITGAQIGVFASHTTVAIVGASLVNWLWSRVIPPGDFRGVILTLSWIVLMYLAMFAVYRAFLYRMPIEEGDMMPGSRGELIAQVNILFYLIFFNSLIRTHFLPVPLMRWVYLALGARLGPNTYSAGTLLDPALTVAGANCIIGHDAVLFAHAIEGDDFSLAAVRLGDDVTIGAMAIVMSDVHIGHGAIVSAGSVVLKGTRIAAGEVWGGVPARRLRASPPSA